MTRQQRQDNKNSAQNIRSSPLDQKTLQVNQNFERAQKENGTRLKTQGLGRVRLKVIRQWEG